MVNSYVNNCIVISRHIGDGSLFIGTKHGCLARLDGYLIVPKERIADMEAFMAGLLPQPPVLPSCLGGPLNQHT